MPFLLNVWSKTIRVLYYLLQPCCLLAVALYFSSQSLVFFNELLYLAVVHWDAVSSNNDILSSRGQCRQAAMARRLRLVWI